MSLMFRCIAIMVVTTLHELSHWKVRKDQPRCTPPDFYLAEGKPQSDSGSGLWLTYNDKGHAVELALFGGFLHSVDDTQTANCLQDRLSFQKDGRLFTVDDSWAKDLVNRLLAGEPITSDDLQIKDSQLSPRRQMTQADIFGHCGVWRERNLPTENHGEF